MQVQPSGIGALTVMLHHDLWGVRVGVCVCVRARTPSCHAHDHSYAWQCSYPSAVGKAHSLCLGAAASVLARQLVDLAHHRGCKVISLVRRQEQVQELLAAGCAQLFLTEVFGMQHVQSLAVSDSLDEVARAGVLRCLAHERGLQQLHSPEMAAGPALLYDHAIADMSCNGLPCCAASHALLTAHMAACRADQVFCIHDDYVQQVLDATSGRGAYGAVDCVVGEGTVKMVNAVRPGGTILLYGLLSGATATVPVADILFQGKVVRLLTVSSIALLYDMHEVHNNVTHMLMLCTAPLQAD